MLFNYAAKGQSHNDVVLFFVGAFLAEIRVNTFCATSERQRYCRGQPTKLQKHISMMMII